MRWLIAAVAIVACAIAAIAVHAVLPAKVDEDLLDGVLVRQFGFAAVAVAYFLALYIHCFASVTVSWRNSRTDSLRHGLALGSAFAVLYMIGMQEIMVDKSPLATTLDRRGVQAA